jgi:dipeptidyl-peptidase-4
MRLFTGRPPLGGYPPHSFSWAPDGKAIAYLIHAHRRGYERLRVVAASTGHLIFQAGPALLGRALRSDASIRNERLKEWSTRYGRVNYRWSPHGHHLLLINGQAILELSLRTRRLRTLVRTDGWVTQYGLSPHAHWLSYVEDHEIRLVNLAAKKHHPFDFLPARRGFRVGALDWTYREELGLRAGYAWAPQGRKLAFIRFDEKGVMRFPLVNYLKQHPTLYWQRYPEPGAHDPRARLGVYDTRTNRVRWFPLPGLKGGYLARFGWYAGGHALYAEVLNRPQTRLTLFRINPANGQLRVLLRLHDPDWINVHNDLVFLPHGGFIFGTDQDGWHHLYRFSPKGREIASLTPGPYNVSRLLTVSRREHTVYYLASPGTGPRTERIESVSFDGRNHRFPFPEPGSESARFSPKTRYVLLTDSTRTMPPVYTVRRVAARGQWTLFRTPVPRTLHLRAPRFLRIASADPTVDLNAEILYPPDFHSTSHDPVIMYQYGGPDVPALISRGWNPWIVYEDRLACEGFVFFEADNRAASTFSHTAQGAIKDHLGRLELADQEAAVRWLRHQAGIDPKRIGTWGWSYGGYMTLYELTHAPAVWRAGIAVAPVTRWQDYDSIYTERYMGTPQNNPTGYRQSSTVAQASRLRARLLIVAGTGDDNVHWQNTLQFIEALIKSDRPYHLLVFPNNTHVLAGTHTRLELFRSMNRFWERNLAPRFPNRHGRSTPPR